MRAKSQPSLPPLSPSNCLIQLWRGNSLTAESHSKRIRQRNLFMHYLGHLWRVQPHFQTEDFRITASGSSSPSTDCKTNRSPNSYFTSGIYFKSIDGLLSDTEALSLSATSELSRLMTIQLLLAFYIS